MFIVETLTDTMVCMTALELAEARFPDSTQMDKKRATFAAYCKTLVRQGHIDQAEPRRIGDVDVQTYTKL